MQIFQFLAVLSSLVMGLVHPVPKTIASTTSETRVLAATIQPLPTVTAVPTPPAGGSPTPSPQKYFYPARAATAPVIDCVGPDGKHFHTTQKACDDFNAAWGRAQSSLYPTSPYGKATKIADHTYELKLPPDSSMANAQDIFLALNTYRQRMGINVLSWNATLTTYAQSRASFYTSRGSLDAHAGFMNYINNQDGFAKLGFNHLGENAAYAGPLTGQHLIEWVYASDEEHNSNQLNTDWKTVGIGVSGIATDIIFASSPR